MLLSVMPLLREKLAWLSRILLAARSEERRVGKSVDLGGRRIIKKKKNKNKKKKKKKKQKHNQSDYCKQKIIRTERYEHKASATSVRPSLRSAHDND